MLTLTVDIIGCCVSEWLVHVYSYHDLHPTSVKVEVSVLVSDVISW